MNKEKTENKIDVSLIKSTSTTYEIEIRNAKKDDYNNLTPEEILKISTRIRNKFIIKFLNNTNITPDEFKAITGIKLF